MNKIFKTKTEAVNYFGHSWKYIERHYKVQYCYNSVGQISFNIKTTNC